MLMSVDLVDVFNSVEVKARVYAEHYANKCVRWDTYMFEGWSYDSDDTGSIIIHIMLEDSKTQLKESVCLSIDLALFFQPGGFTQINMILKKEEDLRQLQAKELAEKYDEDRENRREYYKILKEEFKGE